MKLIDEAAIRIARGESKVALIAGGEALASLASCVKAGIFPPPDWTPVEDAKMFSPSAKEFAEGIGAEHGIGAPIQVYPLYENGLRAHRGQGLQENNNESAKLYAEFAQVAKQNILAWSFPKEPETEESIGTVSERNRMICYPCEYYPLPSSLLSFPTLVSLRSFKVALMKQRSPPNERFQHNKPSRRLHPNLRLPRHLSRYPLQKTGSTYSVAQVPAILLTSGIAKISTPALQFPRLWILGYKSRGWGGKM